MARRKSTAKREDEFIDLVLKLSSLGVFFVSYLITSSFKVSIVIGVIGLITSITFLIIRKMKYVSKLKRSKISDVDKMTGIQFEYYLKLIFSTQGYKVQTTRVTGDYGADLVITKDQKKFVVQAKRYTNRVGLKAVQEVHAAIAFYGANEGWVVTNSEFTAAAKELAKSNNIRLIEREELVNLISQLNNDQPGEIVQQALRAQLSKICSRCGSEMVLRKSHRGEFYGCSSFPKCRYTEAV